MSSENFFTDLPALADFTRMVETGHYEDLPLDWSVVMTDVKNSTRAIEQGRYKEVNTIGVSTIVAVQNALGGRSFPFIFGGDGATMAVPATDLEAVRRALSGARAMAQRQFDLVLRVAIIPVNEIRKSGAQLKIGKLKISDQQFLALARGDGWSIAEAWMKEREDHFALPQEITPDGSFAGLECRWNPLPARNGEVMAVIIQARVSGDRATQIYGRILREILEPEIRPLKLADLKLTWPPRFLMAEAKVRIRGHIRRVAYFLVQQIKVLAQVLFLRARGDRNRTDPVEYLREVAENTDYIKFDECLRVVIDVDPPQKARLLALLDEHARLGEILYGAHSDPCALLTCYIQGPHKHIHFVDAAGGGYAMAAKQLKSRRNLHASETVAASPTAAARASGR